MISLVENILLGKSGVKLSDLESALDILTERNIDYGDLYFQQSEYESWGIEDSKVKTGTYSLDRGVGVRSISDEKTGFAYSDDISVKSILLASETSREIGQHQKVNRVSLNPSKIINRLYTENNPLDSLTTQEKISLLQDIDSGIRSEDSSITQVFANLIGVHEHVLVIATDGTLAADIRPLVRLNVTVVVEKNGQREQGSAGMGGRYILSEFLGNKPMDLAREALRQALTNLGAKPAPAGSMDVVLGPGWPGVLLHEAVGHGLEADFNRKETSVFSNRIGEKVASSLCTVVDDGSMENRRGSLQIDDEGTPTERTVLIENGILKNYMYDKLNARLMGTKSTGNARRESYAYLPLPRMTNTFMLNGNNTQEQMIAAVEDGIYAANFGGGQVDITSGKFVFSASEAYRVKNGKILYPIKGATLIGNGPEVMQKISMVGNDMELDKGVGVCGKEGQSLPVGVGQPSLLINNLVVGGTDYE